MKSERFVEMLGLMPEDACPEEVVEKVRGQLEESRRFWFHDISGDGTCYEANGRRFGVSFARGSVRLQPDGKAVVRVETGQRIAPELDRAARKLFSCYSSRFKVPGLAVEEGHVVFVTEPFDPLEGRFDVEKVLALAFSTVHAFGGVVLALDSGVEPWSLLDYNDPDAGDDDDDGGEDLPLSRPAGEESPTDYADRLRRSIATLLTMSGDETEEARF